MKRFIIISLLAVVGMHAQACLWVETHNYYLFSVYDNSEFRDRVNEATEDVWKAYLGMNNDEGFWFDADRLVEAAREKGDQLMADYVVQLKHYLDCCRVMERKLYDWDYPTADELSDANDQLTSVRTFAEGKLDTKMRSQHALLFMRCNMLLDQHKENVKFWEKKASDYPQDVYKDMMKNIYAGALLKTGKADKAGAIFAEQGDWQSLMTQFYELRSYEAIRAEYQRDPKSAVLPFLLQDFVNNTQEAVDEDGFGKLFVRDIQQAEGRQMIALCQQVVAEGKTQYPALWQSARAWIEFMYGDRQEGLTHINEAIAMEGTTRMKDNARVLQFFMRAMLAKADAQWDDYMTGEIKWLQEKAKDQYHYEHALDRITHQALYPLYDKAHRTNQALGLLNAVHAYQYHEALDTMQVDRLIDYVGYLNSPGKTNIDRYIKSQVGINANDANDLIGTKYLRLGKWQQAQTWLQKVPVSYYDDKGYKPYIIYRNWSVEPWIKRQWLTDAQYRLSDGLRINKNPKLEFASEMLRLETGMKSLTGKARQQRCYDLAVRYAQATNDGDCWYLTHNGKSVYDDPQTHPNEADLEKRAIALLKQASQTTDFELKERALFALAYVYLNDDVWYEDEFDSDTRTISRQPRPATIHYKVWAQFLAFERANPGRISRYVQRCEQYIDFKRLYRK